MAGPYIVTTKARENLPPLAPSWRVSRHAVATLEEAKAEAASIVEQREHDDDQFFATALLPESGGTVGPLPDRTVIEVEQTTYVALADVVGDEVYGLTSRQLLDAYNAQQQHPGHRESIA